MTQLPTPTPSDDLTSHFLQEAACHLPSASRLLACCGGSSEASLPLWCVRSPRDCPGPSSSVLLPPCTAGLALHAGHPRIQLTKEVVGRPGGAGRLSPGPQGLRFPLLQQSSLRRRTQVPPPPCSLLGSLEQGSPPLPTWPSAGHQRLPCGHIQGSPFRSHLSQLSEPLPAPQDSVFSRLGGCAWVHLASLLHPDRLLGVWTQTAVLLSPPFFPRWARPASWCLCS